FGLLELEDLALRTVISIPLAVVYEARFIEQLVTVAWQVRPLLLRHRLRGVRAIRDIARLRLARLGRSVKLHSALFHGLLNVPVAVAGIGQHFLGTLSERLCGS